MDKIFSNGSFHGFNIEQIKPYDASFAFFASFCFSHLQGFVHEIEDCAASRNISFDDNNKDNIAAFDFGICFMIDAGWFKSKWINFISLLGFFIWFVCANIQIKGDIKIIYNFHVTFDNNTQMFFPGIFSACAFLFFSNQGSMAFLNMLKPSSLYNPILSEQYFFLLMTK